MRTLSLAFLAAVALVIAPSVAQAGPPQPAPGAKNVATLTLRNGTAGTVFVTLNPSLALQALAAAPAGTPIANLQAQANADGSINVLLPPGGIAQVSPRPNTPIVTGVVGLNAVGVSVPTTANLSPSFTSPGGQSRTQTIVIGAAGTPLQFVTTNP
jgi:hypothetical protein